MGNDEWSVWKQRALSNMNGTRQAHETQEKIFMIQQEINLVYWTRDLFYPRWSSSLWQGGFYIYLIHLHFIYSPRRDVTILHKPSMWGRKERSSVRSLKGNGKEIVMKCDKKKWVIVAVLTFIYLLNLSRCLFIYLSFFHILSKCSIFK